MRIRTIPRSEVLRLLESLGHDPEKVAAVHIGPGSVVVEYVHPITDGEPPRHGPDTPSHVL